MRMEHRAEVAPLLPTHYFLLPNPIMATAIVRPILKKSNQTFLLTVVAAKNLLILFLRVNF